ncbi:MAG: hypothetical protein AAGF46_13345, partial [Pseudomonadota bacterium]
MQKPKAKGKAKCTAKAKPVANTLDKDIALADSVKFYNSLSKMSTQMKNTMVDAAGKGVTGRNVARL